MIRPIVTYRCEAWTMTKKDENLLRVFEMKILTRICGPLREGQSFRMRTRREVEDGIGGKNIVGFVKSRRIEWLRLVQRMEEERPPQKLLFGEMYGVRKGGRPRKRWLQDIEEDLRALQVRTWKDKAMRRYERRRIQQEAKVHNVL